MPLGDCTAIFFSSPAFTMVLSFIILKWVGLNFKTFLHGQWSSGITAGWYASLLHLLCWLGYQDVVLESRVLKPPPQVLVLSRPPALFPSLPLPPGNVSINYLKWNSTKDDWSDSGNAKMCSIWSIKLSHSPKNDPPRTRRPHETGGVGFLQSRRSSLRAGCAIPVGMDCHYYSSGCDELQISCFQFLPSPASPLKLSGKACALFYPGVLVSSNVS